MLPDILPGGCQGGFIKIRVVGKQVGVTYSRAPCLFQHPDPDAGHADTGLTAANSGGPADRGRRLGAGVARLHEENELEDFSLDRLWHGFVLTKKPQPLWAFSGNFGALRDRSGLALMASSKIWESRKHRGASSSFRFCLARRSTESKAEMIINLEFTENIITFHNGFSSSD